MEPKVSYGKTITTRDGKVMIVYRKPFQGNAITEMAVPKKFAKYLTHLSKINGVDSDFAIGYVDVDNTRAFALAVTRKPDQFDRIVARKLITERLDFVIDTVQYLKEGATLSFFRDMTEEPWYLYVCERPKDVDNSKGDSQPDPPKNN